MGSRRLSRPERRRSGSVVEDWTIQTKLGYAFSSDGLNHHAETYPGSFVPYSYGSIYATEGPTFNSICHLTAGLDVTAKATYHGSNPGQVKEAAFAVTSQTNFGSSIYAQSDATGTVSDFFGGTLLTDSYPGLYGDSKRLNLARRIVRVPVDASGVATFTYHVGAEVTSPLGNGDANYGGVRIGYRYAVSVETRFVKIDVPGHDAGNMRKELIPGAQPIQFTADSAVLTDSNGDPKRIPVGAPYAPARAAPQLPASGLLDYHRELDYGLPLGEAEERRGETDDNGRTDPSPISITYNPNVGQAFVPDEHYRWNESLRSKLLSADLPLVLGVPWAINSLSVDYTQPMNLRSFFGGREVGRTYENHDRGANETVSLHYAWNDGFSADASVTVHLHQAPADDWTLLGILAEVLPNEPFVRMYFETGESDTPTSYWSLTGNPYPQNVVVQPAGINWIQGESMAAAGFAVGAAFAPEAAAVWLGLASAILGESTNFTPPPAATTEPWAYASNPEQCDAVIESWNARGCVLEPDYKAMMPLIGPEDAYWKHVRWHVDGQPATIKQFYLEDRWEPHGYEGQAVESRNEHKGSPLDGTLQYHFDFPSLRATLEPDPNPPPIEFGNPGSTPDPTVGGNPPEGPPPTISGEGGGGQ